jgi:hypothetical protein
MLDPEPGIYGYQADGYDFKSPHVYTILSSKHIKSYAKINCQSMYISYSPQETGLFL